MVLARRGVWAALRLNRVQRIPAMPLMSRGGVLVALALAACSPKHQAGTTAAKAHAPPPPAPVTGGHAARLAPTDPSATYVQRGSCVVEPRLFTTDQGLLALGLEGGRVAWKAALAHQEELVHCDSQAIVTYVRSQSGVSLRVRSPADGAILWQTPERPVAAWADVVDLEVWSDASGGYGVHWTARNTWRKGYSPAGEDQAELRRKAEGTFRVVDGAYLDDLTGGPTYPSSPELVGEAWLSWDEQHSMENDDANRRVARWAARSGSGSWLARWRAARFRDPVVSASSIGAITRPFARRTAAVRRAARGSRSAHPC